MRHKHRVSRTSAVRCYHGGAKDQRAAGNVEWIEYCACGAERKIFSNGNHVEAGKWKSEEQEN